MKAVLYMKLRGKLYRVSNDPIDVPDGLSFIDIPMEVGLMKRDVVSGQFIHRKQVGARFYRYSGLEEMLGTATLVFHAPDDMNDANLPPNVFR